MLLLINVTTAVIWQPWLSSQAVKRIAGTLNYFLKYLTGMLHAQFLASRSHGCRGVELGGVRWGYTRVACLEFLLLWCRLHQAFSCISFHKRLATSPATILLRGNSISSKTIVALFQFKFKTCWKMWCKPGVSVETTICRDLSNPWQSEVWNCSSPNAELAFLMLAQLSHLQNLLRRIHHHWLYGVENCQAVTHPLPLQGKIFSMSA